MIDLPHTSFMPAGYARSMFSMWLPGPADTRGQARRRTLIAVGGSLLIHALLLLTVFQHPVELPAIPGSAGKEPITVHLAAPPARPRAPVPPVAAKTPPPPRQQVPSRPKVRRKSPVIAMTKRRPSQPSLSVPAPSPPAANDSAAAPTDMMSMVQAARERRRAAEEEAARINAEARAGEGGKPSQDDIAMANIRRSLQQAGRNGRNDGAGGVFQVVSKGVRTGTFIFRGWTPGQREFPQQTFEVDAGPNGDVERALVRRMIELIRSHYSGDFNWDSHRLGRVVVKSARPEDSAELEAFLMQEFFGDEGPVRSVRR